MISLLGTLNVVKNMATNFERIVEAKEEVTFDDEGNAVKGSTTREMVKLHQQPATGKDLESLSEGDRTKEAKKYWSLTKTALGDKIIIDGEIFTVRNVKYWEAIRLNGKGIGYYEGMMTRSGEVQNIDEDA